MKLVTIHWGFETTPRWTLSRTNWKHFCLTLTRICCICEFGLYKCHYHYHYHYYNSHWTSVVTCALLMYAESYARKHAVVRFNLQQQVVHRYIHHSVSQQERLVHRQNSNLSADDMLPWVQRYLIQIVAAAAGLYKWKKQTYVLAAVFIGYCILEIYRQKNKTL